MDNKYNIGYFGDARLEKTGWHLCHRMEQEKQVCVRRLGKNNAGDKQFRRFLANKKVTIEEIEANISQKTSQAVKNLHALVLQDTTELNYQKHAGRVRDLGPVGNGKDLGCFIHPGLVLNAQDLTCLGLSSIKCWQRNGESREHYKKLLIEEKESYRWLETAEMAKERLKKAAKITIIADRESDIYEEWVRIPDEKTNLITRACRDRKTANGSLYEEMGRFEVAGVYEFEVKSRKAKKGTKARSTHRAKLEIRFGTVEIKKPGNCTDKNAPKSLCIQAIDVREVAETVVAGEDPIHWRILTSHVLKEIKDVLTIVEWYCARWNIEQLFRTLKRQGLDIESSQLESGFSIQKLAVIATYVATMIMQMVMARTGKDQNVSVLFDEQECNVLAQLIKKLEGKTEKQKNPHPPHQLSWASWGIARLGGWNGYPSSRPPGPITMFHGIKKFLSILDGWNLFNGQKDVYAQ